MLDESHLGVLERSRRSFAPIGETALATIFSSFFYPHSERREHVTISPPFDPIQASLVFKALLDAASGSETDLCCTWDGTHWLLKKSDGLTPTVEELQRSLLFNYNATTCRIFVEAIVRTLQSEGGKKFNSGDLLRLEELLTPALKNAEGFTMIGILHSAAEWVSTLLTQPYGSEIGGIVLGLYTLGACHFLNNAFAFHQGYLGPTDHRALGDILAENSKQLFADFFAFNRWFKANVRWSVASSTLRLWSRELLARVARENQPARIGAAKAISLIVLFFDLENILAAMTHGLDINDRVFYSILHHVTD